MPNHDEVPAKQHDPAATDVPGKRARNGAEKRRDPKEPAAVVGLGASAGGVSVLQQFFDDMPAESGMAFVVVMHLSPDFESQLANVLQQKTAMPVIQVSEPVHVRPNHVYVIPPNHQLTFDDSRLHLREPQQAQGRRVTIDLFFRTLAMAYGQRSVCVILSGTDSDGVIGLKHIRAQGGVTIAQDPDEAEFNSMPLSAIQTGMVDWVLKVSEMTPRLLDFVKNENAMQLPPEIPDATEPDAKVADAPGGETVSEETRDADDESAIAEVLKHVRVQTGHDFTHYKRATVLRRIARRMQVNSVESIPLYLDFLQTHPAEARALLHDLLIGVTHFFRDQESFAALEAHIPQIFAGRKLEDEIRVWVPGCATGEEAYSIGMLLCEHAEKLHAPPKIQIFATDIDEQAIHVARQGVYPLTIEADVSQERLRAFFRREDSQYRVRKELRDMVLFAAHNLLADAPFSRVDLITCRNLLIYLTRTAQEQVFDIFHFALKPGGLLFIGGAETGEGANALFTAIDGKHRLYVRRSIPRPTWKIPVLPLRAVAPRQPLIETRPSLGAMTRGAVEEAGDRSEESGFIGQERRAMLFGELHLKLLEEYGPPSIVVNEDYDIVHLSEHAGRFLTFRAGEPTTNLIKVIHPDLRVEVRTALFRAAQSNERITVPKLRVNLVGGSEILSIQVRPVRPNDEAQGFFVVLFEKQGAAPAAEGIVNSGESSEHFLAEQIEQLKHQLNATVEQYEASSEELKASNEELQAMNEEMRSATEELETSKEELQSVNEELITVNHELKEKVVEISRINSDLQNLMGASEIGTVFLDRQLRIQRFTPPARDIFNLQTNDVGRPIGDITHRLNYDRLLDDAHEVLERLRPVEHEVLGSNARHLLARIAPYRTADDKISGVVLTFIDITERKRAEEALRKNQERQARVLETETVGVLQFNQSGTVIEANDAFLKMTGYTRADIDGRALSWMRMTPPEYLAESQQEMKKLAETGRIGPYEKEYFLADGSRRWMLFAGRDLGDGTTSEYVIDIHDRKHAEAALRESEARFREFAENSADVFWIVDAEKETLEYLNPVFEEMFGEKREALMQNIKRYDELIHPEDSEIAGTAMRKALAGERSVVEYRIIRPSDGEIRWVRDTGFPIPGEHGRIARVGGVTQDVTEDKERTLEIQRAEERFQLLVEGTPDYAMFLLDPDNTITYWSTGAEKVFGWSAGEAIGQEGAIIFIAEDKAKGEVEKEIGTALEQGYAPDRRWHKRKDGSRLWADGIMRRIDRPDGSIRGFAKICRDATEQREIEDALRHAKEEMEQRVVERTRDVLATNLELERTISQRQQLERELLEISEREKRRIGEDLHDMVCQELTATALFLKSSAKKIAKENLSAAATLEESAETVNRNVVIARELAGGLQAIELSAAGLRNALRELAARACLNTAIKCHFKCARGVRVPDDASALHLYRVAQEAVTNAVKHSGAKNILISLDRNPDHICVSVQDDGKGLNLRKRTKGLGLHMMRYRANALGGELKVERRRTGGTDITCVIPVKR